MGALWARIFGITTLNWRGACTKGWIENGTRKTQYFKDQSFWNR